MLTPYQMGDEALPWVYEDGCREEQPLHFGTEDHLYPRYCPFQKELTDGKN